MQQKMVNVMALKPLRYNGVDFPEGAELEIEEGRVREWVGIGLVVAPLSELAKAPKPERAVKEPGETADKPKTREKKA